MSLNVPIIDVHRDNFKDFWPAINVAIQTASFISLDAELSGLGCRRKLMAKSIEDRFKAIADVAKTRSLLSLGISCFKLVQNQDPVQDENQEDQTRSNGQKFLVQTFNILTLCDEDYVVEPGALQFLVGHGFDFNKQYSCGVPYYRGFDKENDKMWPSLRLLFNNLLAARKPLTLHNGLVDLIFLYQNLYTELPPTSAQWVADLSEMYPTGVIDTKYVAEYQARMPASYLEYVFRKSQRDNEVRKMRGSTFAAFTFCEYSPDMAAVEYQLYAIPADYEQRHKQGSTKNSSVQVCEIYAAHGHCAKGNRCPKSHDPDAILDAEEIVTEEKSRRKRRKRNRKNRNQQGEMQADGGNVETNGEQQEGGIEAGETEGKRVKEDTEMEEEDQNMDRDAKMTDIVVEGVNTGGALVGDNVETAVTDADSTVAEQEKSASSLLTTAQNGASESANAQPNKGPKRTGSHRAGFDAFMTGFATAAFLARFGEKEKWMNLDQDRSGQLNSEQYPSGVMAGRVSEGRKESIIDQVGLGDLVNKLYLSGKEYPLAIAKSSFTKTSANHKDKMVVIDKLVR